MQAVSAVSQLEREWEFETGFFGMLRRGEFDPTSFERLMDTLDSIAIEQEDVISRRVVSLLWLMPLFMEWQKERVQSRGFDMTDFERSISRVQSNIERLLGLP